VRSRLLIGTLALTLAAVGALFIPAAVALAHAEGEAQVVELQAEAADAVAQLTTGSLGDRHAARGLEDGDGSSADGGPAAVASIDDHLIGVYGADGSLVDGEGPATLDPTLGSALLGRAGSARIDGYEVVALPLSGGGALRAAEPSSEADDRTRAAVVRLAVAALLVLLAAAVAAWLLARRLTRPLGQLRTAAARLGAGDFTTVAPVTGVAEVDEVGDALNTSANRIGDLVERERRLSADTAHQLRTPVAGLRLALEGELVDPRPDRTEVLREALGAVDRLEATVAGLSDLARNPGPGGQFDLADVATSAVAHWTGLYARSGRTLVPQVESAVCSARRVAVETIVDVLLDNALKHGAGTVVVRAEPTGGGCRLSVADEGTCRIPDEQLFARHASSGGSTGIGLDLARTLAAAEGGRIRLSSSSPTVFELLLPKG
jgi:signal transduction histidine kinase